MNQEIYEKIHKAQIERLKTECERMANDGTIVTGRYNPEYVEDCDMYIADRCRGLAEKGVAQVLDEAVHQMAADYFNDELHGKWEDMNFEPLEAKNTEKSKETKEKPFVAKKRPEPTKVLDQMDLFAAGV